MIVEFYGIPGGGKSTIAQMLADELAAVHPELAVYRRWDLLSGLQRYTHGLRVRIQYLTTDALYRMGVVSKPVALFHEYFYQKYGRKLNSDEILYTVKLNDMYSRFLRLQKSESLYLMDEGIIQFISSVFHAQEIEADSDFEKIAGKYAAATADLYVYCDIPNEEAVCRIKMRAREGDRFITSTDEEMCVLLNTKRNNLRLLSNRFAQNVICLSVDTSRDSEDFLAVCMTAVEERI